MQRQQAICHLVLGVVSASGTNLNWNKRNSTAQVGQFQLNITEEYESRRKTGKR